MAGPWDNDPVVKPFDLPGALAQTDKALGLPSGFSAAQIKVESGFDPSAVSPKGAMGLAQVMPDTLATLSKRLGRKLDPMNPADAVDIHREVMRENLAKFGTPDKALMAYNGGWDPAKWANPETQAYVGKVSAALKGQGQSPVVAAVGKAVNAVMPSAQAGSAQPWANDPVVDPKPWDKDPVVKPSQPVAPASTVEDGSPEANLSAGLKPVGNLIAGLVRGAGSIGATILAPVDMAKDALAGKGLSLASNRQRRADMDNALESLGAQPDSLLYKGGKLAGEVAGTAGAGGVVANGARVLGASAPVVDAIASGGFSGGGNLLTRAAGGAINGAATAGLVNPSEAGMGAGVGAVLPGGVKLAGAAGNALSNVAEAGSKRLMQSAIKPTIAQLRTGDAQTAVDTLLQYGISPTKEGVNKIKALIDDLNSQVSTAISGSTATVSKQKVLDALNDVRGKFGNQVSPTEDLNTIQRVADDFAAHPNLPTGDAIPVQQAQQLKQGTYSVLAKKYGQIGTADTEAQKGLARGLKEEVATAVPEVGPLNAEESRLITTLNVAERRALMEMNKNPVGLTALAHNPIAAAGFLADRSAAFKALAARMINNAAVPAAGYAGQKLVSGASNPLLRAAGLGAIEANP